MRKVTTLYGVMRWKILFERRKLLSSLLLRIVVSTFAAVWLLTIKLALHREECCLILGSPTSWSERCLWLAGSVKFGTGLSHLEKRKIVWPRYRWVLILIYKQFETTFKPRCCRQNTIDSLFSLKMFRCHPDISCFFIASPLSLCLFCTHHLHCSLYIFPSYGYYTIAQHRKERTPITCLTDVVYLCY